LSWSSCVVSFFPVSSSNVFLLSVVVGIFFSFSASVPCFYFSQLLYVVFV
jgi:hypothetical protein